MPVFKAFLKILKKTLPSLSIYVIIFLALSFFLSGSGKEDKVGQFTKNKIDIAVINNDEGTLGSELKTYIGTIHNLVELENDKELLQDELYNRNVEYILFIPKDFTSKLMAGDIENLCENVKVPGSSTGKYLDSQINQYISTLDFYLVSGVEENNALEYTTFDLTTEIEVDLLNSNISTSKTDDYYYFLYLPYIFMSLIIMGLGPILMVFNKKEINDRTMCSALPLRKKNMQIILGCVVTVLGVFILFMLVAFSMYGKNMGMLKEALYLINSLTYAVIATAMAYLVSIFAKSDNVLSMVTNVLGLGMSFLGGIFVPREILGENVLNFSKFLPTYWYVNAVDAIQKVSSDNAFLKEIQISIGIEMIFAIAIFAVALVATRISSEARTQIC